MMTEQEAIEWVREQNEDEDMDPAELIEAFTAVFERAPDQDDYDTGGLWSHLCAAVF